MRILVLSDSFPPYNLGGAGEVADLVAGRLARAGHQVLVIAATARRAEVGQSVAGQLVSVQRIWCPVPAPLRLHLSLLNPLAVLQVARIAARFNPDVVHAHNVHERLSFASLGASRAGGAPLVLTAHDYLLFCLTKFLCSRGDVAYRADPGRCPHCRHIRRAPGRNRLVQRIVASQVGTIVCISRAQQTALRANLLPAPPTEVIHNGIDPAPCRTSEAERQAFLREHGLEGRPLVLFGGRISGAKGGDQLIRAAAHARRRVDLNLLILGDRPAYTTHARRLADEAGLPQDRLHTPGWLTSEALRRALGAADVCATPSVYPDPFNLMNLRAMAHRKPVVGTCYGGTAEIVVDGETGYLADPWDVEAYGDRIADVLLDSGRAQVMGEAGRRRVERDFTLERQAGAYEALFARLLKW
ncbi:MAG TPA: glycosyltransferase family 4 protein [Chloroflexota bacterium]|nr:glycosyltransferase family 4 protein [Chloroflexota bacterium]